MKIDSYKIIKYIFYILCIISLFLSIKSNVYADSCVGTNEQSLQPLLEINKNLVVGRNQFDVFLNPSDTNIDYNISGANYIKGYLYWVVTNNGNSYTSNININETCNAVIEPPNGNASAYETWTITYADGSTATISGYDRMKYCSQWNVTGSQIFTQTYQPSISQVQMQIITPNNNGVFCDVDSNGMFTCPYTKIHYFRFTVGLNYNNASVKLGLISKALQVCTTDTQTIINNNNQNTQTIVNNITDDNITGNDSNTAINNIGNTFDTENDFLLGLLTVPYNFFNSLLNIFEDNCSSLNLGTMFDKPLVFPCISLNSLLGNVFTNVIDVIFCGIIMSAFLRRMVKYYQALLSLDERATQIGGVKIW